MNSVEEAFKDADDSEKRWREWEHSYALKTISIKLPESDYKVLENLAREQHKTAPQLVQALVHNVLSTFLGMR